MQIVGGQILSFDDTNQARIESGVVRIADGYIHDIVKGDIPDSIDYGGPNALISPGFIDAHLHLPQFDMIGAHGLPLLRWLNEVTFPAELKWADVDYARAMTARVLRQCVDVGTTGICAYATVHHKSTLAALDLANDFGIRGVIGQVLMDRNAPESLCRSAEQLIDEAAVTLSAHPAGSRVAAAVTPRFAVSCSQQLLAAAGELASEQNAIIQTHLAETERECDLVRELFDGVGYVDVYRHANLLTDNAILGHGIHLSSDDRSKLSRAKSTIAHCPTANSFLRSGAMNRDQLRQDGVTVALGSDVGAGYERSMVRVARAMIETASATGDRYPSAAQAWHQITAGNADALGWSDAGRLAAGSPADLLVIEPDLPWLQGDVDPLAMLLFAWDDRWLKQTFILGKLWG